MIIQNLTELQKKLNSDRQKKKKKKIAYQSQKTQVFGPLLRFMALLVRFLNLPSS